MSVWLERRQLCLTLNDAIRYSAYKRRREIRDWRTWAASEADGTPAMVGPVTVTVAHLRKTRASLPDLGAPFLAVKGVIDGLVDAGVIPSDGPDVVRRLTFEAPEVVGYHGLRVVVREIETHAPHTNPKGLLL